MPQYQPPKGTRDFLPAEMAVRRAVMEKMRKVFESYGYGEVCTPAFEDFELLARKSGPAIEQEIYAFTDKAGRKLGLRFDPTVPICRIVASNPSMAKPAKFYYITNMWRYDNPGAGRWREFWQAGAELIGPAGNEADAEILAVVGDALRAAGVKDFTFRINSRKIVDMLVDRAGIPEKLKSDAFRALDKLGKMGEGVVLGELENKGISKESAKKLLNSIRNGRVESMELSGLMETRRIAEMMGAGKIAVDLSIVRGIDYYTGFVFETFVKDREGLGSVASGGRYDNLIGIYSGRETPATGFGIGVDRIMEIIGTAGENAAAKVFVVPVKDECREKAMEMVQKFRREGIPADFDLMGRDLRKQLDYINSRDIPFALIVGPKELKEEKFTLRDMKTGKENKISLDGYIAKMKRL
jgi:histidyl-tRNA synthetase